MFPIISAAVSKIISVDRLRWLAFGHFEADECGAMNERLAAASKAELMHGAVACRLSITDWADRPPRVPANGEIIDIGGRKVRYIDTHHVPLGWDAGVILRRRARHVSVAIFFTRLGDGPALIIPDIVEPAMEAERFLRVGDTVAAINALADRFDAQLRAALK